MSKGFESKRLDRIISGNTTDQPRKHIDVIRKQSQLSDLLEGRKKELDTVALLHSEWQKLRKDGKKINAILKRLNKSMESLEGERERLYEKRIEVEKDLDALQISGDSSEQKGIIENIQYLDADTKKRMILTLVDLSQQIEKKGIKYLSIKEIKKMCDVLSECASSYMTDGENEIERQITECSIEVEGTFEAYIDSSKPTPLKSAKDYIQKFEQSIGRFLQSSKRKLEKDHFQARRVAWKQMGSTSYFQKKVRFYVDNNFLQTCTPFLTDAITFVKNSETPQNQEQNQEFFERKVAETEAALSHFDAELRRHSKTGETVGIAEMEGFREASNLYRALLNKQEKALAAYQRKDALQVKLDNNKNNLTTDERNHIRTCIQFLDTAITDLQKDKQAQKENSDAYMSYMETMQGKTRYIEIVALYRAALDLHVEQEKSNVAIFNIPKRVEKNKRRIANYTIQQAEDFKFNKKFQEYLVGCQGEIDK